MFGIGIFEIIFIFVLLFVLIGPKEFPKFIKSLIIFITGINRDLRDMFKSINKDL